MTQTSQQKIDIYLRYLDQNSTIKQIRYRCRENKHYSLD